MSVGASGEGISTSREHEPVGGADPGDAQLIEDGELITGEGPPGAPYPPGGYQPSPAAYADPYGPPYGYASPYADPYADPAGGASGGWTPPLYDPSAVADGLPIRDRIREELAWHSSRERTRLIGWIVVSVVINLAALVSALVWVSVSLTPVRVTSELTITPGMGRALVVWSVGVLALATGWLMTRVARGRRRLFFCRFIDGQRPPAAAPDGAAHRAGASAPGAGDGGSAPRGGDGPVRVPRQKSIKTEAEQLPVTYELRQLYRSTQTRIERYHQIATDQARVSFRNAQMATAAGFAVLCIATVAAVFTHSTTGAIAAGSLGITGSVLAAYIGRTFVSAQESTSARLQAYFAEPFELSRILSARLLLNEITGRTEREAAIADLARTIVGGGKPG
ncbi:hypothetical protein [Dactylosporangium sp. CA-139066]|uniref:hypothetical protein n=1 Tax=Dactylosporangium sp. CA-139066 TaxID=3239930 RepID=UPI003D919C7A